MWLPSLDSVFLVRFLRTFGGGGGGGGGGGFYAKSVGFWGSAPDPDGGAYSAFSKRTNGEFSITVDIDQTLLRWFIGALNMQLLIRSGFWYSFSVLLGGGGGGGGGFYAKSVGFWGSATDPDGGAYSAPPYPLAGREGCPPPAPSPGRPRLLLRPTPCHTTVPPPPLPPKSWIRRCVHGGIVWVYHRYGAPDDKNYHIVSNGAVPPGDQQSHLGINRATWGSTEPPEDQQSHLGINRATWGSTEPPEDQQSHLRINRATWGSTEPPGDQQSQPPPIASVGAGPLHASGQQTCHRKERHQWDSRAVDNFYTLGGGGGGGGGHNRSECHIL